MANKNAYSIQLPVTFFFILAAIASSVMVCENENECFTKDGCAESRPGVICAECVDENGYGWMNGSTCVYETFVLDSLEVVTPIVSCGLGRCLERGECRNSQFGVRCNECSNRGFLVRSPITFETECFCYDDRFDPSSACKSLYDVKMETIPVVDTFESLTCESYQNPLMGFWVPTSDSFKYGTPDPPIPNRCIEPYGPPPGQLTEDYPPYQTCATLGGFDPDEKYGPRIDEGFRTCSGHGVWNATSHQCKCDPKWDLAEKDQLDYYGNPVETCDRCRGEWGPSPPDYDDGPPQKAPFCFAPYFEDEFGIRRECSGHGTFEGGSCICYQSDSLGYWQTTTIRGVETCAKCLTGYGPQGRCTEKNGKTVRPSLSPTKAPQRTSICSPCPEAYAGGAVIGFSGRAEIPNTPVQSVCNSRCSLNRTNSFEWTTVCPDDPKNLATELCTYVSNCEAIQWVSVGNQTTFSFANSTTYSLSVSTSSFVSRKCPPTMSPTRAPTRVRTEYPTFAPTRAPILV